MLKVLELFGGIGACTKALKRLHIDFQVVDYVEIDKFAVKSYNAINGTSFQPQDISKWDKDLNVDLIMHGSPCQDFSLTGLNKGGDEAYEGDGLNLSYMNGTSRRGRVKRGMTPTLPAKPTTGCVDKNLRLRKLTPKEYFRLMGFDDYDFEKACQVNSDSQLYKQAGNSIVVNVLEAIFKNLLIEDELPSQKEIFEKTDSGQLKGQMNIFDFLRG